MTAPLFTETVKQGDEKTFRAYNLPVRTDGFIYVEGTISYYQIKLDQTTIWIIISGILGIIWFYMLKTF